ncbi:MAG: radical SAM protein [Elusimicrobiales bacterium]
MIYPLTSKCNQRCIFCSAVGRNDVFEIEKFKEAVSKTQDKLIVFSGGEPFTLPLNLLVYLIDFCNSNSKQIEIQTNALLINRINKKELKILVHLLLQNDGYFNVNLSSHRDDVDFKITGIKNGFKRRFEGIKILKGLGAIVRITHVINEFNYRYLEDFADFLIKNSDIWNWVQFSFVKAIGRACENKMIVPRYASVKPYLLKALEKIDKCGFEFWVDHIPLCFLGKFYNHHVDVEKMRKRIKGEYIYEKKKLPSCKGCKFYRICSGPRVDYVKMYGSI